MLNIFNHKGLSTIALHLLADFLYFCQPFKFTGKTEAPEC